MTRRIAGIRGGALTPHEYRAMVKSRVTKLARRLVPDAELYKRSLGAFPTVVRESLDALPWRADSSAEPSSPPVAARMPEDGTTWADDEFDPVEAQWYFDMPSVQRLLSSVHGRSMLGLGVPSLGRQAARLMNEVRILDRSKVLERNSLGLTEVPQAEGLEVIEWDLDAKPYLDAPEVDVVVMDPPWYLEHYRAWLHTAVEACRIDGTIAVVLPQILTNRSSVVDRRQLLEILRSIGQVSLKSAMLSYVTPSFERAVLDTRGIGHLGRWRQADLALVRLHNKQLPYDFESVHDIEWKYREVHGRIVRSWGESVREHGAPVIQPGDAATGYRLTSVSRFYLRASGINLITSQGGAAVVTRWGRLPRILDLLRDGYPPQVAVKMALPETGERDQYDLVATLELILFPYGLIDAARAAVSKGAGPQ